MTEAKLKPPVFVVLEYEGGQRERLSTEMAENQLSAHATRGGQVARCLVQGSDGRSWSISLSDKEIVPGALLTIKLAG